LNNPVLVGTVYLRDPANPRRIIEDIPMYEEMTPETEQGIESANTRFARYLSKRLKDEE